ncbi:MAG: acetylglutamate kinase [Lentisphaerae bacterium]|nr:MAG: acetylglutamate kinase [Lentisphaerota bacterium]
MPYFLEYIRKAAVLIEALPYIQKFHGAIVVIKLGGSILEDPEIFSAVLRDIVFLESVGQHPVIVHGGGKDISARLKAQGIETRFIDGLRYTCEKTIEVVDDVLHAEVNPRIVNAIHAAGGKAGQLSGKQVLEARKLESDSGADLGYVGDVTRVDIEPIRKMIRNDIVPVITPVARDAHGQAFNINADVSACRIAQALKARKLVFFSDVPGLLRDPQDESSLISTIRADAIESLIAEGVIQGGMIPKIRSAVEALAHGCEQVHLIDARLQHAILLEIFTDEGVGTQILPAATDS